jgi:carboxylesterase type B
MGRQERRSKQPLNDLKEMRGYWKAKQDALYCTLWRPHFGRDHEPVIYIEQNMV